MDRLDARTLKMIANNQLTIDKMMSSRQILIFGLLFLGTSFIRAYINKDIFECDLSITRNIKGDIKATWCHGKNCESCRECPLYLYRYNNGSTVNCYYQGSKSAGYTLKLWPNLG